MYSVRPSPLAKILLLVVLIGIAFCADAQEAAERAEPARQERTPQEPTPQVTEEQLEALREELSAGRERLAPLIETIDPSAAEAWLAESPLESLIERAADPALEEAEEGVWQ
ncbi:MAG: hypothetical protein JXB36_09355, partial [Gammaproteobacteria bacterium]|nr:hypothetical protein [Gammaproteobacteria bacterium]